MILDDIVKKRREQLDRERQDCSPEERKQLALADPRPCLSLYDALRQPTLSVLAEVKKASPSKGLICADFDPVSIAQQYQAAGANAISVLTEEHYFKGSNAYLAAIRQTVSLPLLRKDFILEADQIYHAKLLGADAVLLIAALLDTETLAAFWDIAKEVGLSCLAEVHDRAELDRVLEVGFPIIGINNRNLKTFDVDLNTTARLSRYIPESCVIVAESGISSHADMQAARQNGADAVLVGETLMKSGNIAATLQELRRGV